MHMEDETFQPLKGCILSAKIVQRLHREERRMRLKLAQEFITPAPMDEADRLVYAAWVRSLGGSANLAALLLGEQQASDAPYAYQAKERKANKLVFKLAKHIRNEKIEFDLDVTTVHQMVMGIKRAPVTEILEDDYRMRLRASVEQEDPRRVREDHLGLHLQVDWEQINSYTVPNGDVDLPFYKRSMGKRLVGKSWVPNLTIRALKDGKLSKEYVALSDFGPWSAISENRLVKEFQRRWYQDCSRLAVVQVPMSGGKERIGGMMLLPTAWHATKRVQRFLFGREDVQLVLCCPMAVKSAESYERSKQPRLKYRKLVLGRGHQWITTKKIGPMILEVTLWATKEQGREGYAIIRLKKAEMSPWEWGKRKKELLRNGWTESSHSA